MAAVESDDPVECPCMDDEDIDCQKMETECSYRDLKFPEFSEEDKRRIKESVRRGLDRRMEIICEQTQGRLPCPAHRSQPEYDP